MACYFKDKKEDDIERFVNEKIYLYLKDRELTQSEEAAIKDTMADVILAKLLNHEMNCIKGRGADRYSMASLLIAIAAVLVTLFLKYF